MRPRAATASLSLARMRQLVLIAMGWTIVVVGVLIAPLPGPFGLPVMIVGGIILLRNSANARKLFARAKRRAHPRLRPIVARLDHWRMSRRVRRRR